MIAMNENGMGRTGKGTSLAFQQFRKTKESTIVQFNQTCSEIPFLATSHCGVVAGNLRILGICLFLSFTSTIICFLPEAKPTGLVEAMSVRTCVRVI